MMKFFEQRHGIYFDDLDIFGVLHNARYPLLVERTIGAFWQHLGWGGLDNLNSNPDQFHLVRVNHLEYLRAVEGVNEVRARVWIQKLGRTSLIFAFSILPLDEDRSYATGYRVLVSVDPKTRKPSPWSDAIRHKLTPYCETGD
jgi:acyl-CoA thioester hydrolase